MCSFPGQPPRQNNKRAVGLEEWRQLPSASNGETLVSIRANRKRLAADPAPVLGATIDTHVPGNWVTSFPKWDAGCRIQGCEALSLRRQVENPAMSSPPFFFQEDHCCGRSLVEDLFTLSLASLSTRHLYSLSFQTIPFYFST
jgi:hypothetical protein